VDEGDKIRVHLTEAGCGNLDGAEEATGGLLSPVTQTNCNNLLKEVQGNKDEQAVVGLVSQWFTLFRQTSLQRTTPFGVDKLSSHLLLTKTYQS
jgi:hypothetical protein